MKSYKNNPFNDVIKKASKDKERDLERIKQKKETLCGGENLSFLDVANEREIVRHAKELGEQILSFIDIVRCYINTSAMFPSSAPELEKEYPEKENKLLSLYREYKKEIKKRPGLLKIPDIKKDRDKIEIIMQNFS